MLFFHKSAKIDEEKYKDFFYAYNKRVYIHQKK